MMLTFDLQFLSQLHEKYSNTFEMNIQTYPYEKDELTVLSLFPM